MQVESLESPIGCGPQDLAADLRGQGLSWLDGGPDGNSVLCWGPVDQVDPGPGWPEAARRLLRPRPRSPVFSGGLVGAIGYEAGGELERMPEPRAGGPLPGLVLRRYEGAVHVRQGRWSVAGSAAFRAHARQRVAALRPAPVATPTQARVVDEGDPQGFRRSIERLLEHIAAGDCYQANLARRLLIVGVEDALDVYRRVRTRPAEWGAFLELDGGALLSNSPELFLRRRGQEVVSRPIKGTRPLGRGEELLGDPKERAELTMIVDLVRNDLGRVCVPGSVRAEPRQVRALPTLLHAEQAVSGRLRPGLDALDLLGASFPPGSVTGAPKVQAMQLIRELEPVPRGLYTGAVGWFDDGGDLELSVAIRVAQVHGDRAWVHVGCGIVADSQPLAEVAESRLKFEAWRQALPGGDERSPDAA